MTSLHIRNLSVRMDGKTLVDQVSFDLIAGKVSILLGPNGAGKSMLLSCLAGLRSPSDGNIILGKTEIKALSPLERARTIGLLPQSGEVNWNVTARTIVELGRLCHRSRFAGPTEADHEAVRESMVATDIVRFSDRPVMTLSGGERARVLLARVLASKPQWLLADEPLANLDPAHQMDVLDLLERTARQGKGVLAVLHDLTHAARFADHVILMARGRIVAMGTPRDVLTPEHILTAYNVHVEVYDGNDGQPVVVPKRWPRVEGAA